MRLSYSCTDNMKSFFGKHNSYVNELFGGSLEVGDGKAFWNYIKRQRTESIGIPPLQVGDKVFYSNEGKAEILSNLNLF